MEKQTIEIDIWYIRIVIMLLLTKTCSLLGKDL